MSDPATFFLSEIRQDIASRQLRKSRDNLLQELSKTVGSNGEYSAFEPHGTRQLFVETLGSPKLGQFRSFVVSLIWEDSDVTSAGHRIFQHTTQYLVRYGDGSQRTSLVTTQELDHNGEPLDERRSFGYLRLNGTDSMHRRSWSKTPPSLRYASLEELQDLTTAVTSWKPAVDEASEW